MLPQHSAGPVGRSLVKRRERACRGPSGGCKWSVATDAAGILVAWAVAGANRNDIILFDPTVDQFAERGLHHDIDALHLDRGYRGARIEQAAQRVDVTDLLRPPNESPTASAARRASTRRWDCAGASSAPTRGRRTTDSCDATPTGTPCTVSPGSHSTSPSSSSTTATAGTLTDRAIGAPADWINRRVWA